MKELLEKAETLGRRLAAAEEALSLDETRRQIAELEGRTTAEGFWDSPDEAEAVMKRLAALKRLVEPWDRIETELGDLHELSKATGPDEHAVIRDLERRAVELEAALSKLEFARLFSGPYDRNDALCTFSAGAGGTDAQDWAEMLLRMMMKFAERKQFEFELLQVSSGEEAGIKSATLAVRGPFAYGWLKSEAGVHRLIRLSPFDADHARHTSFALVEVVPEIADQALEIPPEDLKIETFRASGAGGQHVNTTDSAVRITHLPTGLTASCQNQRSQHQNKEVALKVLAAKLAALMAERKKETLSELKGERASAEWANQIRSYFLHPYTKVKDHRTGHETGNADEVLSGELEPFVEAFLEKETHRK